MSDPRWFRLLIRAIGVLTLALNLPRIGTASTELAALASRQRGWTFYTPYSTTTGGPSSWWNPETFAIWVGLLVDVAQLGLAVYLVCGAPRLVRFCIREVGHRCAACDYDLRGLKGICPECGLAIPPPVRADS